MLSKVGASAGGASPLRTNDCSQGLPRIDWPVHGESIGQSTEVLDLRVLEDLVHRSWDRDDPDHCAITRAVHRGLCHQTLLKAGTSLAAVLEEAGGALYDGKARWSRCEVPWRERLQAQAAAMH